MPEELQPVKLEVAGSNPVSAANYGRVAQWIERLPPEQEVEGSNPFTPTKNSTARSFLTGLFFVFAYFKLYIPSVFHNQKVV